MVAVDRSPQHQMIPSHAKARASRNRVVMSLMQIVQRAEARGAELVFEWFRNGLNSLLTDIYRAEGVKYRLGVTYRRWDEPIDGR